VNFKKVKKNIKDFKRVFEGGKTCLMINVNVINVTRNYRGSSKSDKR
jgi:hypothetical protein